MVLYLKPGQILGLENPLPDFSTNPLCYPAVKTPPASTISFLLLHGCRVSGFPLLMNLLKLLTPVELRRHSRDCIVKLKIPLDSLVLWMRDFSNSCISEDQRDLCHNIKCFEKLLIEEASNAAGFSSASSSLLLYPRLVCAFIQMKGGIGNMLYLFPLGSVREQM